MTATTDGQPSISSASVSSFSKSQSGRSHPANAPSTIKTVVTAPPWARDEPPSPEEEQVLSLPSNGSLRRTSTSRPSNLPSAHSSGEFSMANASRWWSFTRSRQHEPQMSQIPGGSREESAPKSPRTHMSLKDRSMSWLAPVTRRSQDGPSNSPREKDIENAPLASPRNYRGLHISLPSPPAPPAAPFTMAQNRTPGWNTPWTTPRIPDGTLGHSLSRNVGTDFGDGWYNDGHDGNQETNMTTWQRRKKKIRRFLLTNVYAPLLFRFINISLTTCALVIAIRIRILEKRNNIVGAVGASPTLVVIFAPLTLVHVMLAIYSEYFSRPLGLWRTSGKLAHTLVEVVFICAWSAALALCFDNFFTSVIPCATWANVSWYDSLPRPASPLPEAGSRGIGDTICDDQLALICLVGVGLIMYCINLVISLYRIFEKLKYRPVPT